MRTTRGHAKVSVLTAVRIKRVNCVRQSGERILFESFQISPAGIDRDAMRFQGLGAISLWLAHLASISHDKSRHCAAVTRSNAPFDYY